MPVIQKFNPLYKDGFQYYNNATSEYDCTVGTGGDYSTLNAAITAGKKSILVISNITETVSSNLLANTAYNIVGLNRNITITLGVAELLGTNVLNGTARLNLENLIINLDNVISRGLNYINVKNCTININIYSSHIFYNENLKDIQISDSIINSNIPNTTFIDYNGSVTGQLNNIVIGGTGGGLNFGAMLASNITVISAVSITTYANITNLISSQSITITGYGGNLSNIYGDNIQINPGSDTVIQYISNSQIKDINASGTYTVYCDNVRFKTSSYSFRVQYSRFNNCYFNATTLSVTSLGTTSFVNCRFNASLTLTGSQNSFTNCLFGSTTGDGKTITISNGVEKTILMGNRTGADIVDNGTSTEMLANVLI